MSVILAPQIIYILAGNGYEGSILPMRIIMPAMLFVGIAQVMAVQILMPMKKDKILLLASTIGACISLMINFFIVKNLQSVGTAIVLLCSEFIVTTTYIIYSVQQRLVNIPFSLLIRSISHSLPTIIICLICSMHITNSVVALLISILFGGGFLFIIEYHSKESFLRKIYK